MGLSAALACISEGARVIVVGRNTENGQEATEKIKENGSVYIGDASEENTAISAIDL
jgi:NAD(P)-dependent dehydrogenase (short-subunit alcohol dehydrogenase family)